MYKYVALLLAIISASCFALSDGRKSSLCLAEEYKSAEAQLGQNFIIGLPGTDLNSNIELILRRIKPGGIVLYSRNYKSIEQLTAYVKKLQSIALKETGMPFFIMIDEEPQGATRLGIFSNVLILGLPDWQKIDHNIQIMGSIGVNVDLAPIADFPYNKDSFIKRRIPAENEEDLSQFNSTYIEVLHKYGIASTLKHFPGLGTCSDDPHKRIPHSLSSQEAFNRSLMIFQRGILSGADLVMTSHAIYDNIDSANPATFSSHMIQNILERQLKFKGLIITDDLSDMPVSNYRGLDSKEAAILSIKAGHNLILLSHNLKKTMNVYEGVLLHSNSDTYLKARINENYTKIVEFKKNFFKRLEV